MLKSNLRTITHRKTSISRKVPLAPSDIFRKINPIQPINIIRTALTPRVTIFRIYYHSLHSLSLIARLCPIRKKSLEWMLVWSLSYDFNLYFWSLKLGWVITAYMPWILILHKFFQKCYPFFFLNLFLYHSENIVPSEWCFSSYHFDNHFFFLL